MFGYFQLWVKYENPQETKADMQSELQGLLALGEMWRPICHRQSAQTCTYGPMLV